MSVATLSPNRSHVSANVIHCECRGFFFEFFSFKEMRSFEDLQFSLLVNQDSKRYDLSVSASFKISGGVLAPGPQRDIDRGSGL